MAIDFTTLAESSQNTNTNWDAKMCIGVTPTPRYKNLEEWLQRNPVTKSEEEDVDVVRLFYTSRESSQSEINIWYAEGEFGFFEDLPERVRNLDATYIVVELPRASGVYPIVEVNTKIVSGLNEPRTMKMHELIRVVMRVMYDDDDWTDRLPVALVQWEVVFPQGESWGIMRIVKNTKSPGPSRHRPINPFDPRFLVF